MAMHESSSAQHCFCIYAGRGTKLDGMLMRKAADNGSPSDNTVLILNATPSL